VEGIDCEVGLAGWQFDLTSEVPTTPELCMPYVPSDSIAGRADALRPALVCSWTDGGRDAAWVHLAGALDVASVPQLEQTLGEPQLQARLVVLDLRELEFIDSSGVQAILNESSRARHAGRRLVLLRGPPTVDRMFTLSGRSDQLDIGELAPAERQIQEPLQVAEHDVLHG
jgi:anti-anti-sigma factor